MGSGENFGEGVEEGDMRQEGRQGRVMTCAGEVGYKDTLGVGVHNMVHVDRQLARARMGTGVGHTFYRWSVCWST